MDLHPDFSDLLAEFVRCGVRFVLLGGYAVGLHVKPRATKDRGARGTGTRPRVARAGDPPRMTAVGSSRTTICRGRSPWT
jgi:hypothetical protein